MFEIIKEYLPAVSLTVLLSVTFLIGTYHFILSKIKEDDIEAKEEIKNDMSKFKMANKVAIAGLVISVAINPSLEFWTDFGISFVGNIAFLCFLLLFSSVPALFKVAFYLCKGKATWSELGVAALGNSFLVGIVYLSSVVQPKREEPLTVGELAQQVNTFTQELAKPMMCFALIIIASLIFIAYKNKKSEGSI